eukprot:TRINITY_DN1615_c0_g1_i1.p1 TRINITY_DN1615_c0_g1~~TRINITY_DN1615_c0_g1_i1.p1  ORF type:complete len:1016 (-),score=236.83 TRINITY_DN1615_c0_g1_i1:108-3125(-)
MERNTKREDAKYLSRSTTGYLKVGSLKDYTTLVQPKRHLTSSLGRRSAAQQNVKHHSTLGRTGAGLLSPALLAKRSKSTRKLRTQLAQGGGGTINLGKSSLSVRRANTMRGAPGAKTKYVDYTENPEDAPEPLPPKIVYPKVEDGDSNALTITIILVDGRRLELSVTPSFSGYDLFLKMADEINLFQFDVFWLVSMKDGIEQWLDPTEPIAKQSMVNDSPLYLRVRWFKTYFKLVDTTALYLFYLHITQMIVSGAYPVSDKVAIRLAAISIQLNYGDFVRTKHKPGFFSKEILGSFLSSRALESMNMDYLQTRIFSFHRRLKGMEAPDLQALYLTISRESFYWGVTWFSGKGERVGLGEDGLFVQAPSGPGFVYVPMEDVRSVEYTSKKLKLKSKSETHDISVSHNVGKSFVELFAGYYIVLVRQATAGCFARHLPEKYQSLKMAAIPDFRVFMRPKIREIEGEGGTSLDILKASYTKLCGASKVNPVPRFLLQVENRLDNEEILDIVDVKKCNLSDSDLRIVVDAFKETKNKSRRKGILPNLDVFHLLLSHNQLSDGELAGTLIRVCSPQVVELSHNSLDSVAAKNLFALLLKTKLKELDLSHNPIGDQGLAEIVSAYSSQVCSLVTLNLSKTTLSAASSQELMKIVSGGNFSQLQSLDVSENELGDSCIKGMFDSIRNIEDSSSFDLKFLNVTNTSFGLVAARAVVECLRKHNNFLGFRTAYNTIDDDLGFELGRLLLRPNTMEIVDVGFCSFAQRASYAFISELDKASSLTELNLSGSYINKQGIRHLADCLKKNRSIVKLGLRFCSLKKEAFVALADAFNNNDTLATIDLASNDLTSSTAARAFGDSLGHAQHRTIDEEAKSVISELNLSDCGIGRKSMEELVEGLSRNESLTRLHLDGNPLRVRGFRALALAVRDHRILKVVTCQSTEVDSRDIIEFTKKIGTKTPLEILDVRKNSIIATPEFLQALQSIDRLSVIFDRPTGSDLTIRIQSRIQGQGQRE